MSKNWLWARDKMKSARDKYTGKPVMLNTYITVSRRSPRGAGHWDAEDAVYACVYHGTEVVRYYPDGTVEASFAGWPTVTTKRPTPGSPGRTIGSGCRTGAPCPESSRRS